MQAVIVLTALVITACSSTTAPSATEIKVVEKAVMPTPPAALMVAPVRPNPPKDGKTATRSNTPLSLAAMLLSWKTKTQRGAIGRAITPAKSATDKKARVGHGLRVKADFIPLLQG